MMIVKGILFKKQIIYLVVVYGFHIKRNLPFSYSTSLMAASVDAGTLKFTIASNTTVNVKEIILTEKKRYDAQHDELEPKANI